MLCSTGAGCDLMDHVTTQLPSALLNAAVSLAAFAVAGATESYLVTPAAVIAAVVAFTVAARVWGVRVDAPEGMPAKTSTED